MFRANIRRFPKIRDIASLFREPLYSQGIIYRQTAEALSMLDNIYFLPALYSLFIAQIESFRAYMAALLASEVL